jgi:glycosyltransferase involved in cell wall biosynthesis
MSVHNGQNFLSQAINSVLSQSFGDFEFIIIDDASMDGTTEILKDFTEKDSRIRVIRNPTKLGLTLSLNKSLQLVRGEYIVRMDADDVCLPERLEKQLCFMENNKDIGVLGTRIKIIDENDNIIKIPKLPESNFAQYLRRRNVFVHGTLMFRKEALDITNGYNKDMKLAQDYELLLRLSEKVRLFCLPECLYLLRRHKKSVSFVKCFTQIYYTTLAKKSFYKWQGVKGKILFSKDIIYNYVVIYKLGFPFLLRLFGLIR